MLRLQWSQLMPGAVKVTLAMTAPFPFSSFFLLGWSGGAGERRPLGWSGWAAAAGGVARSGPVTAETAQPQRVGDHGDRAERHRERGENRRQDAGGRQRHQDDVVAERPAEVLPDDPQRGPRQGDRVG